MLMLILNAYPHPPALLVGCIHTCTIVMNGAILWEVLMHVVRRSPNNRTLCDESSNKVVFSSLSDRLFVSKIS